MCELKIKGYTDDFKQTAHVPDFNMLCSKSHKKKLCGSLPFCVGKMQGIRHQVCQKRDRRIQGGMSPWSQSEAREGEAASPEGERWKGEVSSPSKEVMEWR